MRQVLSLTVVCALASDARTADACSPPPCDPGFFVPVNGVTIPANTPTLYWQPINRYPTPADDLQLVSLATTAAPNTLLSFTAMKVNQRNYVLVPNQPLAENTSYLLDDKNTCTNFPILGPKVTFQTSAVAPMPTALGNLIVTAGGVGSLDAVTSSGSCTSNIVVDRVMVTLDFAPDARPWREVLHFETLVDDRVWNGNPTGRYVEPGTSGHGRGVDMVFRVCESHDPGVGSPGVGPGPHTVAMRARLPGTTKGWMTEPVTIQLECNVVPQRDVDTPVVQLNNNGCSTTASPSWLALALIALARRKRRDNEHERE